MWLTQTYLTAPAQDFPAYAYLLFNPYTSWNSSVIRSIRDSLRILGRKTEEKLAILMPDEDIDRERIGKELDFRFRPLFEKITNREFIKAGLLISNLPLEKMKDDGSNSRWVHFGFDEFIKDAHRSDDFEGLIRALVECANSSEGDTISRFVFAFEGAVVKSRRSKFKDSLSASISLSGPSIGIKFNQFASIFKSKGGVRTNVY